MNTPANLPDFEMQRLIDKVKTYVRSYMDRFDASHNYQHVQRVVELAKTIESLERDADPAVRYRSDIIVLASLLHDVGDKKYLLDGEDGEKMVENLLLNLHADRALASEVQAIVNHCSYSNEIRDPDKVQRFITEHLELAIVQDADRLDALGAIGIARSFAYNAVKKSSLDAAIAHFPEKLEMLEGMMKTRAGRKMAVVRSHRLREFRSWWEDEVTLGDGKLQSQ